MEEACWYNSKRMRFDVDHPDEVKGLTEEENENWLCAGDTSLVEPEILEDMGVGMLIDGETSRESMPTMKTQECTISPKIFEKNRYKQSSKANYESQDTLKTISLEQINNNSEDGEHYSVVNNESGYSSRVENYNFLETKEICLGDSNDSSDKLSTDPFYLFRRKKKSSVVGEDYFNALSDEIILSILSWLPKKSLVTSMFVCKRWERIARDETLWTKLNLGGKILKPGSLGRILSRGVQILRLAQAEIIYPAFLSTNNLMLDNTTCKLQYLDLSMAVVSCITDLEKLLMKCKDLKKLSLEKCTLNKTCCEAISNNIDLEVLNLTMCEGITFDCVKDLMKLTSLTCLNISWCSLDSESIEYICKSLPSSIIRLNISGYRKSLTDNHLENLVQCCPYLVELDLSDCCLLTINAVQHLMTLSELVHLSLSRCYSIPFSMHSRLVCMHSLKYLNIFGLISNEMLKSFKSKCPKIEVNKFLFSSIARPTLDIKQGTIWNIRVKD